MLKAELFDPSQNDEKKEFLTQEGLDNLTKKLEYLKTIKRHEIAKEIQQAMSFGDLSENSEYDEAKNKQVEIELEIAKIENILSNYEIIKEDKINNDQVNLGSTVEIQNLQDNKTYNFTIVGPTEADPRIFKISYESPVGKMLIGKKNGDVVKIITPGGLVEYKITHIGK